MINYVIIAWAEICAQYFLKLPKQLWCIARAEKDLVANHYYLPISNNIHSLTSCLNWLHSVREYLKQRGIFPLQKNILFSHFLWKKLNFDKQRNGVIILNTDTYIFKVGLKQNFEILASFRCKVILLCGCWEIVRSIVKCLVSFLTFTHQILIANPPPRRDKHKCLQTIAQHHTDLDICFKEEEVGKGESRQTLILGVNPLQSKPLSR